MSRQENRDQQISRLDDILEEVPAMGMSRWLSTPLFICVILVASVGVPLIAFGALILSIGIQLLKILVSPFVAAYVTVDTFSIVWWFFAEMKRRIER